VTSLIEADQRRQDERRRDDVALLRYRDVPDGVDELIARPPGAVFEGPLFVDDNRQGDRAPGGDRPIDQRARIELGAERPIDTENTLPLGEDATKRGVDLRAPIVPLSSRQALPERDQAFALSPAP